MFSKVVIIGRRIYIFSSVLVEIPPNVIRAYKHAKTVTIYNVNSHKWAGRGTVGGDEPFLLNVAFEFNIYKHLYVLAFCSLVWYHPIKRLKCIHYSMMTSSERNALLIFLWGKPTINHWISLIEGQYCATLMFYLLFNFNLNKQSNYRWFETPSQWHHYNICAFSFVH